MKNVNSVLGSLNLKDLAKGGVMAALAILATAITKIDWVNGVMPTSADVILTLKMALGAFVIYMLKNLVSNSSGTPFAKEGV